MPVPYAPYVIGLDCVPEDLFTIRVSLQISPRLRRILSPGEKDRLLTFLSVLHALDWERPVFESLPIVASTYYVVAAKICAVHTRRIIKKAILLIPITSK